MIGNRALAAATACILTGLLCACGPGNTLSPQGNSVDFRLKAVESSLQKAQEELKAIERKQTQNDAKVAETQKKVGEIIAVLQSHGVKASSAPQGSALGVGFARPGAAAGTADAAMTDPGAPPEKSPSSNGIPAPPPPAAAVEPPPASPEAAAAPAQTQEQAPPPVTRTAPPPPPGPKPAVIPAPQPQPDARGRRGFGRVGPGEGPSPATPEAAIAADRAEKPAVPPAAAKIASPTAEPADAPAAPPAPKPSEAKPASPVPGGAETATPAEKAEYNKALQLAINGNPAAAKAAFDQFMAAHPQSPLTPNALYWVGEGAFAGGDYKTAISDFDKVAKGWPGHHKAADSLYKMAMAQEKAGEIAAARATLERYLKDYPNAELAGIARQKLQSLPK
jgi:tol-pal system protein YbgF